MSTVFLKVLNLSINATWIILAVILVRLLLKKAPKWISCVLWALVAVRLIAPFSIESVLSLIPSGEVVPADIVTEARPQVNTGVTVINNAVNPVIDTFAPQVGDSANPLQIVVAIASIVWLAGIAGMLTYALISYLVLRKKVRASVPVGKRIMACDEVKTPFILGVFRPVIYVPSFIGEETLKMVVAHEMAHIKRKDIWWKPLGFLLLSVYWFNPACWIAYILLSRDIESACDEKVIRNKDKKYMAEYSQALLDLSVPRKSIAACPLAFGETGVKGRVKGVLNYKKPAFWIIIVAVLATVVVAVCFLTNPKRKENESKISEQETVSVTTEDTRDGVEILGDIDHNGEQDQIIYGETEENESYLFSWDLEFNGEIIYHGENVLPCHFGDVWYLDLDEDGKEEIFVNVYPAVNSMPQTQYIALKKDGSKWVELENTDVGYDSDNYTNAFPITVLKGKGKNIFEISCKGLAGVIEYDVTDYYTEMYNSEEGELKSVAKDILYSEKYSSPGTTVGSPAAWGVWETARGTFGVKDCIIATHGIQGLGGKFDILGTADVYFKYDQNGKIRVLHMEFTPSGSKQGDSGTAEMNVSDWLSAISLPEGYSFGEYIPDSGYEGCFLISPRVYNKDENSGTPIEWQYSGALTRVSADDNWVKITYKNGIPSEILSIPVQNHTTAEQMSVIGLERSNTQWTAIMLKENHDSTGDYWYFWFVKEGADKYYVLSLSADRFSKEEAIEIANSVVINE